MSLEDLKNKVDNLEIPFNCAIDLSFLDKENQQCVNNYMYRINYYLK